MLWNIHVKNMALIQEVDVELSTGLNILTGETGAGKSIIIGAVNVALGAAGFKGFAREDAEYALVELIFSVENEKIRRRLEELEVPVEDGQVIISRKLAKGRTISKINGETVTVSRIREAAEVLLDIHGQHEHQSLLDKAKHLEIVDEFAGRKADMVKEQLSKAYEAYAQAKGRLGEFAMDEEQRQRECSFLEFEIKEIEEAQLQEDEEEHLTAWYKKASNSRRIMEAVGHVHECISSDTSAGAGEQLGYAVKEISSVAEYDEELSDLSEQLSEVESMLSDVSR